MKMKKGLLVELEQARYEQFTDSVNTGCQSEVQRWLADCNAMPLITYPLIHGCQLYKDGLSVSTWMDIDFLITSDDCSNKTSAVCCNVTSSNFLISHFSLPHSYF